MIFPFRSHRSRVLVRIFGGIVILLLQGANLVRGDFITPNDLNPGDKYQIIFVTKDGRDATSSNIGNYNDFVTQQADKNAALSFVLSWCAVVSTTGVDARNNAQTYAGIPIYNTHGERIADGTSDLWDGILKNAIQYDQFGTALPDTIVWTGSQLDGTAKYLFGTLDGPLGSHDPKYEDHDTVYGSSISTINGRWMNRGALADFSEEHSFYALSEEITVIPEPATSSLLASGCAALLAFAWRWRKGAA